MKWIHQLSGSQVLLKNKVENISQSPKQKPRSIVHDNVLMIPRHFGDPFHYMPKVHRPMGRTITKERLALSSMTSNHELHSLKTDRKLPNHPISGFQGLYTAKLWRHVASTQISKDVQESYRIQVES